jgi:uncharacterized protein (DUF1330 family)
MRCYFLAQITISNKRLYAEYLARFDAIFNRYRGKVLAVDDHPGVLEGNWHHRRLVLIEFPNAHELRRWYGSKEYQELARLRRAASKADILLVHGNR